MATSYLDWDNSWTTTSINASSVADAGTATSGVIANDQKTALIVSVTCAYGGTATEGLKVYIFNDVDGTNYEAVADNPARAFVMPYSTSTTYRRTYRVPVDEYDDCKVHVTNDSGASVTVTVRYKQAVVTY